MLDKSFFVNQEPVAREITMADGTKHTVHFRELPMVGFSVYQEARNSENEDVRNGAIARLIAMSVCNPDGSLALTYEQALSLKPLPANSMMAHILAVNGYGAEEKKRIAPNSGEWFKYVLAMRLGMTIRQLENEMPMSEFHRWQWFHAQYPIDDLHTKYRPAALIAQSMVGGDINDKIQWLQPRPAERPANLTEADVNTLRAFGLPIPGEKK